MKKNAILIYRGNNPLLEVISKTLENNLETKTIDPDTYMKMTQDDRATMVDELSKNYNHVFTDNTMYKRGDNIVSLYHLMRDLMIEDWPDKIKKIADYIKENGKEPVIFPFAINDHMRHFWEFREEDTDISELETKLGPEKTEEIKQHYCNEKGFTSDRFHISRGEKDKKNIYISQLLGEIIGIKVLPFAEDLGGPGFKVTSHRGDMEYAGTVTDALKEINVDPSEAVLLGDHHLRYFTKESIKKTELDSVEFYPICQCCLSINPEQRTGYNKEMRKLGVNVMDHSPCQADYSLLANKVRSIITKGDK